MIAHLPQVLLGSLCMTLFVLNCIFWSIPLYTMALAKFAVPAKPWRRGCTRVLTSIAECWSATNNVGLAILHRTRFEVRGAEGLSRREWYLISCNHRSWVDIVVLQKIFNRRIPFPKYFLKKVLIWVPLLGGAWWALDYPFMKRHSRQYLEKHPEKRGEDMETTRKACEDLRQTPSALLNFPEGTRFTPKKHERQNSPYRNLLRPKAGGVAFVIESMGDKIRSLLDVTIVYPKPKVSLWDLLCGRVKKIVVNVERHEIPPQLKEGPYLEDPGARERFQAWISDLWARKDALIDRLRSEAGFQEPADARSSPR